MTTQAFMTFTEINEKLTRLVKNERQLTHEILNHILLFQTCNGYLKLGYSSMHQYLTRGLSYSDDQAYRRLKAARLINELPEIADQLQTAKLNLSQMAEAQKAFETSERETKTILNKEMKMALIATLEKANNFQTKSILSTKLNLKPKTEEKIKPQSDQTVRLELNLTKIQFEKLQTIKNLVSHQIPDLNTAKALEMVFDFFISKKQSTSVKTIKKNTSVPTLSFVLNPLKNRKPTTIEEVHAKVVKKMTPSFMDSIKQNNKMDLKNSMVTPFQFDVKQSRYISVALKKALFEKSQGR